MTYKPEGDASPSEEKNISTDVPTPISLDIVPVSNVEDPVNPPAPPANFVSDDLLVNILLFPLFLNFIPILSIIQFHTYYLLVI